MLNPRIGLRLLAALVSSIPVLAFCGCGSRSAVDDHGPNPTGLRCGEEHCASAQVCVYCPGGSASCQPGAEPVPCEGALVVECRSSTDCTLGNQCTLSLVGLVGYARCTSLDLPCSEPAGCQRVCASSAECHPSESCGPAILKYGEVEVCQGWE